MKQRTAFLIASGIITFIIVLTSALGVSLFFRAVYPASAAAVAPTTSPAPRLPATGQLQLGPRLTAGEATQIALELIPGAHVMGAPQLVEANGTQAYVVTTDVALVAVDTTTGRVLGVQMLTSSEGEQEGSERESGEHEQPAFRELQVNPTIPTAPESPTIHGSDI